MVLLVNENKVLSTTFAATRILEILNVTIMPVTFFNLLNKTNKPCNESDTARGYEYNAFRCKAKNLMGSLNHQTK